MTLRGRGAEAALFVAVLGATFAFSLTPRVEEHQRWHEQRDRYFSGEVPISGADSYYFVRMARLVADDAVPATDELRHYPSGTTPARVPALSRVIGQVSKLAGVDIYTASLGVTVSLSSLFVAPMLIVFWRMGLPAAGILGALLGSFSPAYFFRSSLRNIDTDGGNLFFVWLLAACMVGVRPDAHRRVSQVLAAATGLALAAFVWWYDIAGFWVAYIGVFGLHLMVVGFDLRRAAGLFGIFLLFSNPLTAVAAVESLLEMAGTYLFTETTARTGALALPNPLEEIEELTRLAPGRTLEGLTRNAWLSGAGLVLFGALALRRWRHAVPLLPIALLGSLGLLRAFRFSMYLAPLVGVGLGAVLGFALRKLWKPQHPLALRAVESALALGLVALLLPLTAYHVHVENWMGPRLLSGVVATRDRVPEGGAILATWQMGYLLSEVAQRASFDDGQAPNASLHYLVSRALTGDDPRRISELAGFLSGEGREGLARVTASAGTPESLLAAVREGSGPLEEPVALFLHDRMVREFPAYYTVGHWDFERGEAPARQGYTVCVCSARSAQSLVCTKRGVELAVDLEAGSVANEPLKRVVFIDAGRVMTETIVRQGEGLTLQLMRRPGDSRYDAHIIEEEVYRSSFNQLFVLGRLPPGFELLVDDWPALRSYKIPNP